MYTLSAQRASLLQAKGNSLTKSQVFVRSYQYKHTYEKEPWLFVPVKVSLQEYNKQKEAKALKEPVGSKFTSVRLSYDDINELKRERFCKELNAFRVAYEQPLVDAYREVLLFLLLHFKIYTRRWKTSWKQKGDGYSMHRGVLKKSKLATPRNQRWALSLSIKRSETDGRTSEILQMLASSNTYHALKMYLCLMTCVFFFNNAKVIDVVYLQSIKSMMERRLHDTSVIQEGKERITKTSHPNLIHADYGQQSDWTPEQYYMSEIPDHDIPHYVASTEEIIENLPELYNWIEELEYISTFVLQ